MSELPLPRAAVLDRWFETHTFKELVEPIGAVVGEAWEHGFRARYLLPTGSAGPEEAR
jgi:hypothetical protein